MISMKGTYTGELGTETLHIKSGAQIQTDAPVDNNGKGLKFSPTDLVCASLCSCMMTLMGIKGEERAIKFEEAEAEIEKVMTINPRRIASIRIDMKVKDCSYSQEDKIYLEQAARNCPVALSIDPAIKQEVQFTYY